MPKPKLPNTELTNKLTMAWYPEDLQDVRSDLSIEECEKILEDNYIWFMTQLAEHGYHLLDVIASPHPRKEKE